MIENVSIVTKILDFLAKPRNFSVLVSIFLISLAMYSLNFLSEQILINLKINDFLNGFSFIIFLFLVGTFFLILVQVVYFFGGKIDSFLKNRRFKEVQKEVFEDEDCFKILKEMYEEHPNSVDYPIDHYCVRLLSQNKLIVLASRSGYMGYSGKQIFPYILQPETVKMLKKKLNE